MRPGAPQQWPVKALARLLNKRERSTFASALSSEFHGFDFLLPAWPPSQLPPSDRFFSPSYQHLSHLKHGPPPRSPKLQAEARPPSRNSVCITFKARSQDQPCRTFTRGVSSAVALSVKEDAGPDWPPELRAAWAVCERAGGTAQAASDFLQKARRLQGLDPSGCWAEQIAELSEGSPGLPDAQTWLQAALASPHFALSRYEVQHVLSVFFGQADLDDEAWNAACGALLQAALSQRDFDDVVKYVVLPYWTACEHLLTEPGPVSAPVQDARASFVRCLARAMQEAPIHLFVSRISTTYSNNGVPFLFFRTLLASAASSAPERKEHLALATSLFWCSEECRLQEATAVRLAFFLARARQLDQAWAVRWSLLRLPAPAPATISTCQSIHRLAFRMLKPIRYRAPSGPYQPLWDAARRSFDRVFAQELNVPLDCVRSLEKYRTKAFMRLASEGSLTPLSQVLVGTFPAYRLRALFLLVLYRQARLANVPGFEVLWREFNATFQQDAKSGNALLLLLAQCGDDRAALHAFNELRRRGVPVTAPMLTTLISVLVAGKAWRDVQTALHLAETDAGIVLDAALCNVKLQAYVRAGSPIDQIDGLVTDMRKRGIDLDQYSVALLLEALQRNNQPAAAAALFDSVLQPTVQQFGIMIKDAYRRGHAKLAQAYVARLVELDLEPSAVIYAQQIVAELGQGNWTLAEDLAQGYVSLRKRSRSVRLGARDQALEDRKDINDIHAPFLSLKTRADRKTRARWSDKALALIEASTDGLSGPTQLSAFRVLCTTSNDADAMLQAYGDLLDGFRATGRLSGSPSAGLPSALNQAVSILIHGLAARGRYRQIGDVWCGLLEEGFEFDPGCWNTLVVHLLQGRFHHEPLWLAEHILAAPSVSDRAAKVPLVPRHLEALKDKPRPPRRPLGLATWDGQPFAFKGHTAKILLHPTLAALKKHLDVLSREVESLEQFHRQFPRLARAIGRLGWDGQRLIRLPKASAETMTRLAGR